MPPSTPKSTVEPQAPENDVSTTVKTVLSKRGYNRRRFIQASGAAAAALAAPAWLQGAPSRTLNIGCIGVGGKGASDMASMAAAGHRIAAVCDIDGQRLDAAQKKHAGSKAYADWRELLDQKGLDAVTVSTPDHTHAPATLEAIRRGLHTYTQKPLTHDVFESRVLTKAAAEHQVITQMGIQHHSSTRLKSAVELVQSGRDRQGARGARMDRSPRHILETRPHVAGRHGLGACPRVVESLARHGAAS